MGPDRKVHGANMGPIWGKQDPCGPHVIPMNLGGVFHEYFGKNDQVKMGKGCDNLQ